MIHKYLEPKKNGVNMQAKPSKAKNHFEKNQSATFFYSKFYQNVPKNIKTIKKYFRNTNDFFI